MATYTICWQRQNAEGADADIQECTDLDPRTALARLIGALRTTDGPIIIHSVTPTPAEDPMVLAARRELQDARERYAGAQ